VQCAVSVAHVEDAHVEDAEVCAAATASAIARVTAVASRPLPTTSAEHPSVAAATTAAAEAEAEAEGEAEREVGFGSELESGGGGPGGGGGGIASYWAEALELELKPDATPAAPWTPSEPGRSNDAPRCFLGAGWSAVVIDKLAPSSVASAPENGGRGAAAPPSPSPSNAWASAK